MRYLLLLLVLLAWAILFLYLAMLSTLFLGPAGAILVVLAAVAFVLARVITRRLPLPGMKAAWESQQDREQNVGRPFQFDLRDMFLAFVFLASTMGTVGPYGVFLGAYLLLLIVLIRAVRTTGSETAKIWLALLVLFALTICFAPVLSHTGPAARRAACLNNLKEIGLALRNYESVHGHFPPAYIADQNGKPMHSWRVLILPYFDFGGLGPYNAYDFNEPWDGPNNSKLVAQMPLIFSCPSDPQDASSGMTSYVAVVGPGTAWPGAQGVKLSDIRDGPANTIVLVEVANAGIPWTQPRDLTWQDVAKGVNPASGPGISSHHTDESGRFGWQKPYEVSVLLADGSARSLPSDISPNTLKALLTVDGGEPLNVNELDARLDELRAARGWAKTRPRLISFAIMIGSGAVLLLRRPKPPTTDANHPHDAAQTPSDPTSQPADPASA